MKENIFLFLLKLLKVPHTYAYSNKYYNQYPLNNTLWGLSQMLLDYGIDNETYYIEDRIEGLACLEFPCVIYWSGNLIVFVRRSNTHVFYYWNGALLSQPINIFEKYWSGIVMFIFASADSMEPNYKKNLLGTIFVKLFILISIIVFVGLFVYMGIGSELYQDFYNLSMFIINIIGVTVSSLLLMKQLNLSKYVDSICSSLLNKSECGTILDSSYSKFFNLFSWAELGCSYFISNIIILTCFDDCLLYMTIVNIFALLYSFWSIWCQKYIIKQWCSLCLLVQFILWSIFIVNLLFGKINIQGINLWGFFKIGFIYGFIIILVNRLAFILDKYKKLLLSEQKFKSIKGIEDVLKVMLKRESFYPIADCQSNIVFQGVNSNKSIYYFTNPYCEPCALKHKEVDRYLHRKNRHCTTKFIFISFGDEFDDASRCLIAVYFKYEQSEVLSIYEEWFSKGKYNIMSFIKKYGLDIFSDEVEQELVRHKSISKELNVSTTPYLLIEGYAFPNIYDLEDLIYY